MSAQVAARARPANAAVSMTQMVQLMRLESERASEHKYPLAVIMIGLDGYERPEDIVWRRRLMPAIFGELKKTTFEMGIKGLGLTQDQFLFALFPHTVPERGRELGEKLVERVPNIALPDLPQEREIRISVGVGHNQHPGDTSFEALVEEAEIGLNLARRGGGGRCFVWRNVETEIDRLRGELEQEIRAIAEQSKAFSEKRMDEGVRWGRGLVEQAIELFDRAPVAHAEVVRMKREVVALLTHQVDELLSSTVFQEVTEKNKQIDLLERRITKLTEHLSLTESELKRIAQMKSIDLGVASIYRSVQGLSNEDSGAEQKQGMLKTIFEANMSFRAQVASKKESKPQQ